MLRGSHVSPPQAGVTGQSRVRAPALSRLDYPYTSNRGGSIVEKPKRPRGRPRTGIGPAISMRLYPEQEAALAAWIERQPEPKPSRSEAIRTLVALGLGLTQPPDDSL